MPNRKRTDENQAAVIRALRQIGATVQDTSAVGGGFPDLVVGFMGRNYCLEVKDGEKEPARRQLTPCQKDWHNIWQGQKAVVLNVDDAIAVVVGK